MHNEISSKSINNCNIDMIFEETLKLLGPDKAFVEYFGQKHLLPKVKVGKSHSKVNARGNFLIPLCVPVGHCHIVRVNS